MGPAAQEQQREWQRLGKALYGPKGILTPYLFRPLMLRPKHGMGPNGCLTLAVIDAFGPIAKSKIVRDLSPFMDKKTAARCVGRLLSADLVLDDEDGFFTPRNLRERIREDEIRWGATARADFLDRMIGDKQEAYQIARLGGPTLARVKSALRKERCFYCAVPPPREGGEIEHFPPKHWGGSDEFSLLLPICRPCNSSHGQKIRKHRKSPVPKIPAGPLVFPGTAEEVQRWFVTFFGARAESYAILLNEGRVDEAFIEATRYFPTWMALKSGIATVDSTSGELAVVEIGLGTEMVRELGGEIGGIPGMVRGPVTRNLKGHEL